MPDPVGPDDDYRLVTLDQNEEEEYIVSARRFGRGEISDAYEQVWSRLDEDHSRDSVVTSPPRAVDVPLSSAHLYITPPSSPERGLLMISTAILPLTYPYSFVAVRIRKLPPVTNIDSSSLDAESTLVGNDPDYAHWSSPSSSLNGDNLKDKPSNEEKGLDLGWTEDYDDYNDYEWFDEEGGEEIDEEGVGMAALPPLEVRTCFYRYYSALPYIYRPISPILQPRRTTLHYSRTLPYPLSHPYSTMFSTFATSPPPPPTFRI